MLITVDNKWDSTPNKYRYSCFYSIFPILTISLALEDTSCQISMVTMLVRISSTWLRRYMSCVTTPSAPVLRRGTAFSRTREQYWGSVICMLCKDLMSSMSVSSGFVTSGPILTLELRELAELSNIENQNFKITLLLFDNFVQFSVFNVVILYYNICYAILPINVFLFKNVQNHM